MTDTIVRQRCVVLTFPATGSMSDLLCGLQPNQVFSPRERRLGLRRGSPASWAGWLAAKAAVLAVLGVPVPAGPSPPSAELPWVNVEILPDGDGLCAEPSTCRRSHRPAATSHPPVAGLLGAGERLAVSISHSAVTALALAARVATVECGGAREAVDGAR